MSKLKYKELFITKIIPLALFVIMIFLAYHIAGNYLEIRRMESEIAEMEERIAEAEEKQEQLSMEVQQLNDPDYIERMARRKLGLVRPGEELIIPYEDEEMEDFD